MSDHINPAPSSDTVYTVSPSVVFRQMDDGAVLLDLESGVYFGLDEIGTRVWSLLLERGTTGAVCAAMSDEFDVEPDVLAADVRRLVEELRQGGLVCAA
jgi:hypothetical protein